MYLITGSIGSGTTLVSKYLHHLGICMQYEDFAAPWEDPLFRWMMDKWPWWRVLDAAQQREFLRAVKYRNAQAEARDVEWGFKCPLALRQFHQTLHGLIKNTTEVTVLHIFRDYNENMDCWFTRKKLSCNTWEDTSDRILWQHERALEGRKVWGSHCSFHVLHIRDIIDNPIEFWELLKTKNDYKPIDNVINRKRLRNSSTTHTYHPDKQKVVYNALEKYKWVP